MNKIKLAASLFAAVVLTLGVSAQTMGEITEKYNQAGAALQAKEFEKAATLFSEVIDEAATVDEAAELLMQSQRYLPTALLYTGRTYAAQQQYDQAIAKLSEARDRAEMYGNDQIERQATQLIGQIYFASGADAYNNERYAEAVDIFAKGFEADPTNTDMALNLARSYDKLDDLDKSVEVYNSIIALEGRHSRYAEAVAEAKKEVAEAVLVRAAAAGAEGNLEEVIRLTELIPENEDGALLRVQVAINKKDYRSVIQYAPEAAELQTNDEKKSEIYYSLGAAYQNTDNTAKAIESLRKVTAGPNVATARQMVTDLSK